MERNNMRARFTVGQDLHGNLKEFMDNGDGTWSDLYNEVIVPERKVFERYPWIADEIKIKTTTETEQLLKELMAGEWSEWKTIVLDSLDLDLENREQAMIDKAISLDNECDCTNMPWTCATCKNYRREVMTGWITFNPATEPDEVLPI